MYFEILLDDMNIILVNPGLSTNAVYFNGNFQFYFGTFQNLQLPLHTFIFFHLLELSTV